MNEDIHKIFFFGIGGIGISALARMMLQNGKTVVGQDVLDSENIQELKKLGAIISIGQSIEAIPKDTDLIVYSRALVVLEPKFVEEIKTLSIPSLLYPELLGLVSKDKYTIAVSGSHGKTTTTGMVVQVLKECGLDPTAVIGSFLQGTKSNFIQGRSDYFVVEADEYYRAFLNLHPTILIILNIDLDHVDYYKDLEDIKSAYRSLAEKIPENGFIICDPDNKDIHDVLTNVKAHIVDYKEEFYKRDLQLPGTHNQIDATYAFCVGKILGIDKEAINKSLNSFLGTWRRFEYKGKTKEGALVYDDYAHHPTEIKATLQAFRERYPKEDYKIHIFFQPHLFSRTKALFNEFVESFTDADTVRILPIFKAREIDDGKMSAEILADEIAKTKQNVRSLSFAEAIEELKESSFTDKDIIVTMGAGEAYRITEKVILGE